MEHPPDTDINTDMVERIKDGMYVAVLVLTGGLHVIIVR